jgi:SAM-dependent methyltransferase/uncharacterized protein YbaR (Trm112 family)
VKDSTLEKLKCVQKKCSQRKGSQLLNLKIGDFSYGTLVCQACASEYPILAGVPILVIDPEAYLLEHVKGVSRWVPDEKIPKRIRAEFQKLKKFYQREHIEEDLESERVTILYWMNHYLKAKEVLGLVENSTFRQLVSEYWDHGPLDWIGTQINQQPKIRTVVELGCGLGGLAARLTVPGIQYLGVDSSFASVAWAQHLYLGRDKNRWVTKVPKDLLAGPQTAEVVANGYFQNQAAAVHADFVVGDLERPPIVDHSFDAVAVLNAIDMLEHPELLPVTMKKLVTQKGFAFHSAPYVWHEKVAKRIRKNPPKTSEKLLTPDSSSRWVDAWFEQCGLRLKRSEANLNWLFLKHSRQLEIYSAHTILAQGS